MSAPNSHTLNLWGILSESKRIINAHSRHFLALSVLFLLPLSFSLIIYPTLQFSLLQPGPNNIFGPTYKNTHLSLSYFLNYPAQTQTQTPDPARARDLIFPLGYVLFAVVITIWAVATITYSTFHGFYGRPVKLVSSMKSAMFSMLSLIATAIVADAIVGFITLLLVTALLSSVHVLEFLGLDSNSWFPGLVFLFGVMLVLVIITLQVNWSLAYVVVVVESKWGFVPLRRSSHLVKGMKLVALSVLLFFGVLIGLLIGGSSSFLVTLGEAGVRGWTSFGVVFQMVVSSGFATLLMLQNIAADVVLYMYCKAYHGELALEIAEEFAREYVCLPFDDEKVPHIVCVVQD